MTPERWRQLTAIFHEGGKRLGADRAAYLDRACGDDVALRAEVESLFAEHGSLGSGANWLPPLPAGTMFGAYRVDALIGAGGMGQVYRATDTRLRRTVALKLLLPELLLDPGFSARFEREARVLASLSHPNIAAIHGLEASGPSRGSGQAPSTSSEQAVQALVLEFVDGPTLAERLERGPIAIAEALPIARQIASALEAAHERGIVHRDLKPANIKITPSGTVKVLDFGIAKLSTPDPERRTEDAASETRTGLVMGTPAYMSPEQARGLAVDKRTDIWAFGCVLFEMLTRRGAFAAATASDSLARVIERDPDWTTLPASVPESIRQLLKRCLQKDPANRLHDIADARIEVTDALAAAAIAHQPTSPSFVGRPPGDATTESQGRIRRWRLVAIVLGVALVAAGLYAWSRRTSIPAATPTSVVALPAQVLGAEDLGYLTDAIPSTLSTQLGQIEGLDTKVPPTSLEFEKIHRNLATIADLYGVTSCIVSSITATDEHHFVLSVQLVEPRTGHIRWGQEYRGERGTYLELAHQAADGIRQELRPASSMTRVERGTASSEAELALREGSYFLNRFNNGHQLKDADLARDAFQRALSIDPKTADAAAGLAILHRFRWEASRSYSDSDAIADIERFARQALAISPQCSKAWSALFWAEIIRPTADQRKLLDYGLKAVSFGPRDSMAQTTLGAALSNSALELGLQSFLESRHVDPLYVYAYFNAASTLTRLGRPAEAITAVDEGLKIEPDVPFGLQVKRYSLVALGRMPDAVALIRQYPDTFGSPISRYLLALQDGKVADAEIALKEVVNTIADPKAPSNGRRQQSTFLIPFLIDRGQADLALRVLDTTTALGTVQAYDWLMTARQFATVRDDPRFKAAEARSRAQFDEMRSVLLAARTRGELPPYLEATLARLATSFGPAR